MDTIKIKKSNVADTRTCDWSKVTKDQLLIASRQHIFDVQKAFEHFIIKMQEAASNHDFDKITEIDQFYEDFKTGFKQQIWYDNHKKVNRHHLNCEEGTRDDVDLVDVFEYLIDCVMAGLGRSGKVSPIDIPNELLNKAFQNTIMKLISIVDIED